ncbi:MAG: chromosome partitioning protein ParA [bacterium (Candidatus Ratteibacteria) CG_4_10_14_3_um_filter_41_18]|uniref:Chromosome partitioning protein ParA n=4 Tax=Candidatus Ratteibacteria TaxID=2979319 RepID=A0A2M7EAG4_9BACT|nr:MAG: chromosome partitioning protein ParA [bacterium (Candidatus Ratteibacteria) CG01_land_8_20_14_3_00_40_19]PIW33640.1 MAG: chromosome partitioning protein ParA [bacterium (Candidatus Ratteibacteria) CG15_BIG_FIL_POST_REV_8_21_14_020_41_12]PIX77075.1 MAG: chromosome partitioning protein ParA [bacterium (Candidatus Ratteibacteria) CG_4_10_14_3_um_filter_41_18]PJA62279.1 MAG: chromosome partitioning protein ParA [bacterium (Candidatus Ratteibacteria) CG_4_9_14_3_um_filter_41_21]
MRIIALTNQKGGTGKTTSAVNLGAGLSRLNKKVLLADLDPQANLTYSLGIVAHELERSVYDLFKETASTQNLIVKKFNLDILPSNIDLSAAEIELVGTPGREFLFKEGIKKITQVDYLLIDCPPSLGLLTINALVAAKEVFIPLQTEFLALQGLSKLLETVEIVRKRLNSELEVTGIIGTRYDNRKNLNRQVVDKIRESFGKKLFKTLIRENISLAEAPSYGQTIFDYQPKSHGAEDYMELSKEVLKMEMKNG